MEDVPLLEEMAEEDEELDLYNEMTFGLGKVKGNPRWADQPAPGGMRMEAGGEEGVPQVGCVLMPNKELGREPGGIFLGTYLPPTHSAFPCKTVTPLRRML